MDVLALSPRNQVLGQITWKRAFALIVSEAVEVVAEYEDWFVRSAHAVHKVPSVVRYLSQAVARAASAIMKPKAFRFSRDNVFLRDRGKCQYCGIKVRRKEMTFDHVLPEAQGGRTGWANIVTACLECNRKKGGRTPEQAKMKLRKKPEKPTWLPSVRLQLPKARDVLETWKLYMTSYAYWNVELDGEDEAAAPSDGVRA